MEIEIVKKDKKKFLDLLLIADESEPMIDKYLERGELFALYDGELISVCVVTGESADTCELKNIATYEKWQGKGFASKLIQYVSGYYRDNYRTMIVGTGDVPWMVYFYEKNGFHLSHRLKNFFIDNYDHPMYEDGVQLVDMVYLKKDISS